MSFVPVTGTATFHPAEAPARPRRSVVEFADHRRTVALEMTAALPVLTKAHTRPDLADLDPSVRMLSGAALLGLRLVAAGRLRPDDADVPAWRIGPLGADDEERVRLLAAAPRRRGWGRCGRCWTPSPTPCRAARPPRPARRGPQPSDGSPTSAPGWRPGSPGCARWGSRPSCRSWCGSRCGSRPTRRSWSRARCGSCCRCTTSATRCTSATPSTCGTPPRSTASATAPAPTPASPCAPRPRRGRCSTGCSRCGCPTRSPSTPTSW